MSVKDFYGVDASDLKNKKLFLFDMDGTIYTEETVIDGTYPLLDLITEVDGRYIFITNNSSKSVVDYMKKVERLGIRATEENFFTSAQATVLYLEKNHPGRTVLCMGTDSLVQELRSAGITVYDAKTAYPLEKEPVILVGFDTELTSEKLKNVCEVLFHFPDAPYIATNPDLRCPATFGFIPDCGAICGMLKNATGRTPIFVGKPEATMVDIVRERFGYRPEETVVIGDRLYTDVATGLNAGVTAVCVLTGEATPQEIEDGDIKPTYTFPSVKEMFEAMKA